MNINKSIQSAFKEYQTGNLHEAKRLVKKILKFQPNNVDILNFLGVILFGLRSFDSAIQYFKKAVQFDPKFADAYFNLGNALKEKGSCDEAISCYRKALDLNPNLAGAYNNLGTLYQSKHKLDEALSNYQKALQLNPNFVDAHYNLGNVFREKMQIDEAVSCYQKALDLNPNLVGAYNNLGSIFQEKQQVVEAISYYQRALHLNPNLAGVYANLGSAFEELEAYDEAITCYRRALDLDPNLAEANNNLGIALKNQGNLNEAEVYYKRAIEEDPGNAIYYSNMISALNYDSRYDAQTIFREHVRFAQQYVRPLSSTIPYTNVLISNRRLKIGYVSPDFKAHSVAYFIEPVLAHHDRKDFEVLCFSDVLNHDKVTKRVKGFSDHWRDIVGMSDEEVINLIRKEQVDILIDLAGHTVKNRLLAFAGQPAPIQASWIGYPATTGLFNMDYKIVDSYTDPPGMTEQYYTEKLIRLPETFLCYLPEKDCPNVGILPALTSGNITFGSFNNFSKISPEAFIIWTKILKAVPNSKLILKTRSLADKKTSQRTRDFFMGEGIAAERIDLLPFKPSVRDHLETYNDIDIGLDTFPYSGTTTTCEAMWMGVPVITLEGNTHVSRVGVSLLSNVGLRDFIAKTCDEYIEIAVRLAGDIKTLHSLRQNLRDRMSQSPLTNAKQFVVNLEQCYHEMWETLCNSAISR